MRLWHSSLGQARSLLSIAQVASLALTVCSTGCGGAMLTAARDESSVEQRIADHLEKKGMKLSRVDAGKDLILLLHFEFEGTGLEPFEIRVDTQRSSDEGERVIGCILDTGLVVSDGDELSVLKVLNGYHDEKFWGTFYVSAKDRHLRGQAYVNIPNVPVHPELAHDAVARLAGAWLDLGKALQKAGLTGGGSGAT